MDKDLRAELDREADAAWAVYDRLRQRDDAAERTRLAGIPREADVITGYCGTDPMTVRTLRNGTRYFDVWTEELKAQVQTCHTDGSWVRLTTKRPVSGAEYVLAIQVLQKPSGSS